MSEPGTTRRLWWKVHFSTKVVIAIVVVGLVLANVPGQEVMYVDVPDQGKYGPHYGPYPRYEHGWPASYLTRHFPPRWRRSKVTIADSSWGLTQQVESFAAEYLVMDVFVGLLVVGLVAAMFEVWRRRRDSLWRFRLIEMFGLLTLAACAGGWYQWQCRIADAEAEALREARQEMLRLSPDYSASDDVVYLHGGPTFLREIVGDKPFRHLDRVVNADIVDVNPKFANRFLHLRTIRPEFGSPGEGEKAISSLKKLESIDLCMFSMSRLSDFTSIPSLRGINLWESEVTERDLEWLGRCTNLEQIEMSRVNIGDEGLRKLRGLKKLKSLSVGGGYDGPKFTDECFEVFSQLDSLEELRLDGDFRGETIEALLRLKGLKELSLSSPNIGHSTMKRLERFGHLKSLNLSGNISRDDVTRLQAAIPKCEVNDFGW